MNDKGAASVWIKLGLQLAGEAVQRVGALGVREGSRVVELRDDSPGSDRSWDPEILRVDKEIERYYMDQLAERGIDAILLSEEAGRVKIEPRCAPEIEFDRPVYFISDPFDGSMLYKRGIQAFWYSALAIYTRPARPEMADSLASVVVNCIDRTVIFSDTRASFEGNLDHEGKLSDWRRIKPNSTEKLAEAFLETYLMKPDFMYPAAEKFKFLFRGAKFILPNGGPSGFCDVASGKVDVYFAYLQPHTDVFPGIAVAERAGCSVTTFEGHRVKFEDDVNKRFNIVCSANEALHRNVLDLLRTNGITDNAGFQDE